MDSQLEQAMLQGLTEQEARERLATDGYNELPSTKKRTFFHILLEVLREPMFLMLIACGVLYLFLGDQEEAIICRMARAWCQWLSCGARSLYG